jgi:hypothetical protein
VRLPAVAPRRADQAASPLSGSRDHSFQRVLDEARRENSAASEDGFEPARAPRLRAGLAFGAADGSGGKARFGLALDWADEPADRLAPPPRPAPRPAPREAARRSGDTPAEIAAELGLGAPLTLVELTSRWRDFVWRNHPDRQPIEARARANARVAIANALYERARRELAKAR